MPAAEEGKNSTAAFLVSRLVEAGGPALLAVIFFGSHKTGASPSPASAYDFFLVVSDYAPFYRSLHRAGLYSGNPFAAAALNVFLPPNLICASLERDGRRHLAKAAVISARAFERETAGRKRDHFLTARLFQSVEVSYGRTPRIERLVRQSLAGVARGTLAWARPRLSAPFSLEDFLRLLFRISLGAEIKPEGPEREDALYQSQREALDPVYLRVLSEAAAFGAIRVLADGRYALAQPASRRERSKGKRFFARSKVRATARWLKYRWTFEGWREYIARKIDRRTDPALLAYLRERKRPGILAWPRIIRALRRRRRESARPDIRGGCL